LKEPNIFQLTSHHQQYLYVHEVKIYVFLSILQHNYVRFTNKFVTKTTGVFWWYLYVRILSYSSFLTILRP